MKLDILDRLDAVSPARWQSLVGSDTPFTCHRFLSALESSGCVSAATGWQPHHLTWHQSGEVQAVMPCYLKHHSYGEYVFDWSWADAMQQLGRSYFPKLVTAIPFTPVTGPRLLRAPGLQPNELVAQAMDWLHSTLPQRGISSFHLLFAEDDLAAPLQASGLAERQAVQFLWRNPGYGSFEDFLGLMKSAKRKQIRRERARVAEQGIEIRRFLADDLSLDVLAIFLACYQDTYLKRSGHSGYLNEAFFQSLWLHMRDRILLLVAQRGGQPLASALFLFDQSGLYGRYWGALEPVDCLHFELCYYQGIDFAIERGLPCFNPGTQGEHKLMRGFEPVLSRSFHWIAEPAFHQAVCQATRRERTRVQAYAEAARHHLPFRHA